MSAASLMWPAVAGREAEEAFLSVISASELLHGVHRAMTGYPRQAPGFCGGDPGPFSDTRD